MDVVGVEQEVGQVEKLRDQLSDVPHIVSGGRLPFLLHAEKHPLWDIEPPLWGHKAQRRQTPNAQLSQTLQQAY